MSMVREEYVINVDISESTGAVFCDVGPIKVPIHEINNANSKDQIQKLISFNYDFLLQLLKDEDLLIE